MLVQSSQLMPDLSGIVKWTPTRLKTEIEIGGGGIFEPEKGGKKKTGFF